jgi:hypothetical protein
LTAVARRLIGDPNLLRRIRQGLRLTGYDEEMLSNLR